MNWMPEFEDLSLICKTAYEWEKKLEEKIKWR
jgi:UDP-glucose 4-epimerase